MERFFELLSNWRKLFSMSASTNTYVDPDVEFDEPQGDEEITDVPDWRAEEMANDDSGNLGGMSEIRGNSE